MTGLCAVPVNDSFFKFLKTSASITVSKSDRRMCCYYHSKLKVYLLIEEVNNREDLYADYFKSYSEVVSILLEYAGRHVALHYRMPETWPRKKRRKILDYIGRYDGVKNVRNHMETCILMLI